MLLNAESRRGRFEIITFFFKYVMTGAPPEEGAVAAFAVAFIFYHINTILTEYKVKQLIGIL